MVQHLCSLRSFGVPYMSPLAPFVAIGSEGYFIPLTAMGVVLATSIHQQEEHDQR